MGLHTGLYPGGFLHLLCFTAKILDPLPVLHHSLVAAAAQSHIDTGTGIVIILDIGLPVHPHADAQSDRHVIADVHRLHILQDGEPVLYDLLGKMLFHDKEIFILFQFFDHPAHGGDVLGCWRYIPPV